MRVALLGSSLVSVSDDEGHQAIRDLIEILQNNSLDYLQNDYKTISTVKKIMDLVQDATGLLIVLDQQG